MADRTAAETARLDQLMTNGTERTIGLAAAYDHLDVLDAVVPLADDFLLSGIDIDMMATILAALALHIRRRGGDPR